VGVRIGDIKGQERSRSSSEHEGNSRFRRGRSKNLREAKELKSSAYERFPKRVGSSKKPPQNRGDLPDDLSVGAIPELLRANCASWIAMNDEIAFIESATTT
jgi:hypothetical protein